MLAPTRLFIIVLAVAACDDGRRVPSIPGPFISRDAAVVSDDATTIEGNDAATAPGLDASTNPPAADGGARFFDASGSSTANSGTIVLNQHAQSNRFYAQLDATLARAPSMPPCTTAVDGACIISTCPRPPPQVIGLSGGNIEARVGVRIFIVAFDAMAGLYRPDQQPESVFVGGEPVVFSAAGKGELGRFSEIVNAPAQVVMSAPQIPAAGTPMIITRSQALSLAWQGGASEQLSFEVRSVSVDATVSATCNYDSSMRSATIPASVLGQMATTNGGYYAYTSTRRSVIVQPATIELMVTMDAVGLDGANARGQVDFR